MKMCYLNILCVSGLFLAGCGTGALTENQKEQAHKQWNDARASVLSTLAADQYKSGNLEKCQETLDQALRLEPDKANLHLLAAKLSIEQGNLDAAELHLSEARRLDPKDAEADYLAGIVRQRWHQTQKAHDAYAAAVSKNPGELSYLLAQAEMLVALDKPREAIALLQSRARFFEHSGAIRDEIGQLLIGQRRYVEGLAALREASLLATNDPTVREHLAFALYANNQFLESGGIFDRLAKEPTYATRADVFAALGECKSRNQRFVDARKCYESATKLNPSCCGYWLGLAKATIQLNDLPGGELAVRKAISLEPANNEAQCLLGYVSFKQNRLPQSLAAFHAATDLDAADDVSVCLQGYVLSRMGRKAEAMPLYVKALQLNPHNALAARLRDAAEKASRPASPSSPPTEAPPARPPDLDDAWRDAQAIRADWQRVYAADLERLRLAETAVASISGKQQAAPLPPRASQSTAALTLR